jgi:hypothetical protein
MLNPMVVALKGRHFSFISNPMSEYDEYDTDSFFFVEN